jgi:hypothetical protein
MSYAACGKCGREFSSDSAFDRHQTADYGKPDPITCHDPAKRGLVLNRRSQWAWPGNRPVPGQESDSPGLAALGGTTGHTVPRTLLGTR